MIWLFNLLPDWIFHLIVFVSVLGLLASTFFGFIPFIGKYTLPVKIVSIVLLVIGVWFEGGLSNNQAWMDKVHALEFEIAKAEAKANEKNAQLTSQIAAKNKEIATAQETLKNKIRQFTSIIDADCKVPADAISIINESATPGPKGGKR
jgi:cell division protein FtsB